MGVQLRQMRGEAPEAASGLVVGAIAVQRRGQVQQNIRRKQSLAIVGADAKAEAGAGEAEAEAGIGAGQQ